MDFGLYYQNVIGLTQMKKKYKRIIISHALILASFGIKMTFLYLQFKSNDYSTLMITGIGLIGKVVRKAQQRNLWDIQEMDNTNEKEVNVIHMKL